MNVSKRQVQKACMGGFVALMALGLWGGCGGVSAESACEEVCDCVSCSDAALDSCVSNLEESRTRAAEAGCEAEWDEALDCQMSEFVCEDGLPDSTASCDAEESALRRCAGTACDDAAAICGVEDGGEGGETAECTGQAECAAQCIVDNDSCDVTDEALAECLTACAG